MEGFDYKLFDNTLPSIFPDCGDPRVQLCRESAFLLLHKPPENGGRFCSSGMSLYSKLEAEQGDVLQNGINSANEAQFVGTHPDILLNILKDDYEIFDVIVGHTDLDDPYVRLRVEVIKQFCAPVNRLKLQKRIEDVKCRVANNPPYMGPIEAVDSGSFNVSCPTAYGHNDQNACHILPSTSAVPFVPPQPILSNPDPTHVNPMAMAEGFTHKSYRSGVGEPATLQLDTVPVTGVAVVAGRKHRFDNGIQETEQIAFDHTIVGETTPEQAIQPPGKRLCQFGDVPGGTNPAVPETAGVQGGASLRRGLFQSMPGKSSQLSNLTGDEASQLKQTAVQNGVNNSEVRIDGSKELSGEPGISAAASEGGRGMQESNMTISDTLASVRAKLLLQNGSSISSSTSAKAAGPSDIFALPGKSQPASPSMASLPLPLFSFGASSSVVQAQLGSSLGQAGQVPNAAEASPSPGITEPGSVSNQASSDVHPSRAATSPSPEPSEPSNRPLLDAIAARWNPTASSTAWIRYTCAHLCALHKPGCQARSSVFASTALLEPYTVAMPSLRMHLHAEWNRQQPFHGELTAQAGWPHIVQDGPYLVEASDPASNNATNIRLGVHALMEWAAKHGSASGPSSSTRDPQPGVQSVQQSSALGQPRTEHAQKTQGTVPPVPMLKLIIGKVFSVQSDALSWVRNRAALHLLDRVPETDGEATLYTASASQVCREIEQDWQNAAWGVSKPYTAETFGELVQHPPVLVHMRHGSLSLMILDVTALLNMHTPEPQPIPSPTTPAPTPPIPTTIASAPNAGPNPYTNASSAQYPPSASPPPGLAPPIAPAPQSIPSPTTLFSKASPGVQADAHQSLGFVKPPTAMPASYPSATVAPISTDVATDTPLNTQQPFMMASSRPSSASGGLRHVEVVPGDATAAINTANGTSTPVAPAAAAAVPFGATLAPQPTAMPTSSGSATPSLVPSAAVPFSVATTFPSFSAGSAANGPTAPPFGATAAATPPFLAFTSGAPTIVAPTAPPFAATVAAAPAFPSFTANATSPTAPPFSSTAAAPAAFPAFTGGSAAAAAAFPPVGATATAPTSAFPTFTAYSAAINPTAPPFGTAAAAPAGFPVFTAPTGALSAGAGVNPSSGVAAAAPALFPTFTANPAVTGPTTPSSGTTVAVSAAIPTHSNSAATISAAAPFFVPAATAPAAFAASGSPAPAVSNVTAAGSSLAPAISNDAAAAAPPMPAISNGAATINPAIATAATASPSPHVAFPAQSSVPPSAPPLQPPSESSALLNAVLSQVQGPNGLSAANSDPSTQARATPPCVGAAETDSPSPHPNSMLPTYPAHLTQRTSSTERGFPGASSAQSQAALAAAAAAADFAVQALHMRDQYNPQYGSAARSTSTSTAYPADAEPTGVPVYYTPPAAGSFEQKQHTMGRESEHQAVNRTGIQPVAPVSASEVHTGHSGVPVYSVHPVASTLEPKQYSMHLTPKAVEPAPNISSVHAAHSVANPESATSAKAELNFEPQADLRRLIERASVQEPSSLIVLAEWLSKLGLSLVPSNGHPAIQALSTPMGSPAQVPYSVWPPSGAVPLPSPGSIQSNGLGMTNGVPGGAPAINGNGSSVLLTSSAPSAAPYISLVNINQIRNPNGTVPQPVDQKESRSEAAPVVLPAQQPGSDLIDFGSPNAPAAAADPFVIPNLLDDFTAPGVPSAVQPQQRSQPSMPFKAPDLLLDLDLLDAATAVPPQPQIPDGSHLGQDIGASHPPPDLQGVESIHSDSADEQYSRLSPHTASVHSAKSPLSQAQAQDLLGSSQGGTQGSKYPSGDLDSRASDDRSMNFFLGLMRGKAPSNAEARQPNGYKAHSANLTSGPSSVASPPRSRPIHVHDMRADPHMQYTYPSPAYPSATPAFAPPPHGTLPLPSAPPLPPPLGTLPMSIAAPLPPPPPPPKVATYVWEMKVDDGLLSFVSYVAEATTEVGMENGADRASSSDGGAVTGSQDGGLAAALPLLPDSLDPLLRPYVSCPPGGPLVTDIVLAARREVEVTFSNSKRIPLPIAADVEEAAQRFGTELGEDALLPSIWSQRGSNASGVLDVNNAPVRQMVGGGLLRLTPRRNGYGELVELSLRIVRPLQGVSRIVMDFLQRIDAGETSMLVAGRPNSGRSTLLRDIARCLSDDFGRSVVMMDTHGELAGGPESIVEFIGGARLLAPPSPDLQAETLHGLTGACPEILVVDEVVGSQDAAVLSELMLQGVTVVAGVRRADLRSIMAAASCDLRPLVSAKSTLGAMAPPSCGMLVEALSPGRWRVHADVAGSVTALTSSQIPSTQLRWYDSAKRMLVRPGYHFPKEAANLVAKRPTPAGAQVTVSEGHKDASDWGQTF